MILRTTQHIFPVTFSMMPPTLQEDYVLCMFRYHKDQVRKDHELET